MPRSRLALADRQPPPPRRQPSQRQHRARPQPPAVALEPQRAAHREHRIGAPVQPQPARLVRAGREAALEQLGARRRRRTLRHCRGSPVRRGRRRSAIVTVIAARSPPRRGDRLGRVGEQIADHLAQDHAVGQRPVRRATGKLNAIDALARIARDRRRSARRCRSGRRRSSGGRSCACSCCWPMISSTCASASRPISSCARAFRALVRSASTAAATKAASFWRRARRHVVVRQFGDRAVEHRAIDRRRLRDALRQDRRDRVQRIADIVHHRDRAFALAERERLHLDLLAQILQLAQHRIEAGDQAADLVAARRLRSSSASVPEARTTPMWLSTRWSGFSTSRAIIRRSTDEHDEQQHDRARDREATASAARAATGRAALRSASSRRRGRRRRRPARRSAARRARCRRHDLAAARRRSIRAGS